MGVDPYEAKTVLFTSWMMYGDRPDKKTIMVTPHRTMGVQYALERDGPWLPVIPGSDTALHRAMARITVENGWQDQEFLDHWVANRWEVSAGCGRGTRNTRWRWRTTWGRHQSDWEDYREWVMQEPAAELSRASEITDRHPEKIEEAAEMIAHLREDGTRPKTSFMLEKGNHWSNNHMNATSLATLGPICVKDGEFVGTKRLHDAEARGIESGDLVEGYNDTVYVQTDRPVGVKSDDLSFAALLRDGHAEVVEGSFVAVAIVSDAIRPRVTMANFDYSGSQANSVCHAVPDPVSGNYRYKLGRGVLRRVGDSP